VRDLNDLLAKQEAAADDKDCKEDGQRLEEREEAWKVRRGVKIIAQVFQEPLMNLVWVHGFFALYLLPFLLILCWGLQSVLGFTDPSRHGQVETRLGTGKNRKSQWGDNTTFQPKRGLL